MLDFYEDPTLERQLIEQSAKDVDGLVLCSSRVDTRLAPAVLRNHHAVQVNSATRGSSAVFVDVESAGKQIVTHLYSLGHRRAAYSLGPVTSW